MCHPFFINSTSQGFIFLTNKGSNITKDIILEDNNKIINDQLQVANNFNRGHGGLRKEIKVRTPYEALEYWYNLKPDLFIFFEYGRLLFFLLWDFVNAKMY
jgi:hypothetical protein